MSIPRRYFVTGGSIVLILISAVALGRFSKAGNTSPQAANAKIKGPAGAPIHLVVYSDFQCPACSHVITPVEELINQFPESIEVEYRHFPLERSHRWALLAASFAECAAEQNKFWEFHEKLFSTQDTWSKSEDALPFFAQYVQEVGLDRMKLEVCLESPKTLAKIRKEHAIGVKQGVQSTPTAFINDRILVGAIQVKEQGKTIVQDELKKLDANKNNT